MHRNNPFGTIALHFGHADLSTASAPVLMNGSSSSSSSLSWTSAPELGAAALACLVHLGGWHLWGNLLFLLPFGDGVEQRLGPVGTWGLFFGLGSLALWAEAAVNGTPGGFVVGSSGGVAALVGACVALQPRARVVVRVGVVPLGLPLWLYGVLELGNQVSGWAMNLPGVAFVAHTSGLVLGFFAGLALARWVPEPEAKGGQSPLLPTK